MFTSEVHAVRCASARVHACVCARGFLQVPDFFQVSVSVRHVFAATTPLFGRMARLLTLLCAPPPSLLLKTCTGANNEDLTPLIERVIFQLHPDFNNPTRVIDTAPFHVSELGWGEFEVVIKVFFHEGPDTPIELRHLLALFPKTGEPSTKKPVVSEKHDEFVFNQPNEALLQRIHMCNTRLVTTGGQANHSWGGVEPWLTRLNQHDELLRIQAAQRRVQAETELLKEEYARVHETHTVLQEEVKLLDPGKR